MKEFHTFFKKLWSFAKDTLFPRSEMEIYIDKTPPETVIKMFTREPYEHDEIEAILPYRNKTVNEFIKLIKYRANDKAINIASLIFLEKILEILGDEIEGKKWLLVPIAPSRKRMTEYGFDQVALICECIMQNGGIEFLDYSPSALKRNSSKKRQTEFKNREERIRNMENTFETDNSCLQRKVILIDDVTTTGATLNDARRAIKNAGAKKTVCIALAH